VRLLAAILAFSVVSTGLHYSHNFVEVDRYPNELAGGPAVRVAILVSWPLLTAIGLYGYRLYAQGRTREAHVCLLAYAVLGLTTLGHFLDDSPDIGAFWYATIFTDGLAGLALVGFVAWSVYRSRRANAARAPAPTSTR
jgi:hypothetical protein